MSGREDPGRPGLRASDADRDRVADGLPKALAEGLLNAEEHGERLDAVYAAKTYAELAPIVADLPESGAQGTAATVGQRPGRQPSWVAGVFGVLAGFVRSGGFEASRSGGPATRRAVAGRGAGAWRQEINGGRRERTREMREARRREHRERRKHRQMGRRH